MARMTVQELAQQTQAQIDQLTQAIGGIAGALQQQQQAPAAAPVAAPAPVAPPIAETMVELGPELILRERVQNVQDGTVHDGKPEWSVCLGPRGEYVFMPLNSDGTKRPTGGVTKAGQPKATNRFGHGGAKSLPPRLVQAIRNGECDNAWGLNA